MEKKIGEIFEYDGEWYQCVVAMQGCRECSFHTQDYCTRHSECMSIERSDQTSVIFKKLEKVGEPIKFGKKLMQDYKVFVEPYMPKELEYFTIKSARDLTILIEIKQAKENMEEYKMYDAKEDIPEFDKVVDECLFGENKLNLKPFNLEDAKAGKPVCTRDGRNARIICFDRKDNTPIVALIERVNGIEILQCFYNDGKCFHDSTSDNDLMMLPEKKEGWVNVYKTSINYECGKVFSTEQEAKNKANNNHIATIRIKWEE